MEPSQTRIAADVKSGHWQTVHILFQTTYVNAHFLSQTGLASCHLNVYPLFAQWPNIAYHPEKHATHYPEIRHHIVQSNHQVASLISFDYLHATIPV